MACCQIVDNMHQGVTWFFGFMKICIPWHRTNFKNLCVTSVSPYTWTSAVLALNIPLE